MSDGGQRSFSGRARRRTTGARVRWMDRISRVVITTGGMLTIVAVVTILGYLLSVAAPLFGEVRSGPPGAVALDAPGVHALGSDEEGRTAWLLSPDGTARLLRLDDGATLASRALLDERPTALGAADPHGRLAAGHADGSVRLLQLGVGSRFLSPDEVPPQAADLAIGGALAWSEGLLVRTPEGQLRHETLFAHVGEKVPLLPGAPVALVAHAVGSTASHFAALGADGSLVLGTAREKTSFLTGETSLVRTSFALPLPPHAGEARQVALALDEQASSVCVLREDGFLVRLDTRDPTEPSVAETLNVLHGEARRLAAAGALLGGETLVAGDETGALGGWFRALDAEGTTRDGRRLVKGRALPAHDAPVVSLASSARGRRLAAGYADGTVGVYHVTANDELLRLDTGTGAPVQALAFAPRDDAVLAVAGDRLLRWTMHAEHAGVTASTLFLPVWFEGAAGPEHVWQSTGGTDDFEPKLGLVPLVFGTLKATLYSLLFAVPVALLAAIYTSEFLPRRARMKVKPLIELMASLPSVVLGFVAALVLAPFLETVVPALFAVLVAVPCALLLGAHLWQLLPRSRAIRWEGGPRLALMSAVLVGAVLAGIAAGPALERALFAGDVRGWLAGRAGSATGGWLVLSVPAAALLAVFFNARVVQPALRRLSAGRSHRHAALCSLAAFLVTGGLVGTLAIIAAQAAAAAGLDLRGELLGTYVQRNALIVSVVMGFAVVPIIYTLAEDALASVPEHLRAASLASGATRWQTALRVVVPTAMSGLFSAVMIGLGRAVGETMIVLMAAGNTPIMDWNVFNGFRTLSATIAVELPEAPPGSTLYRVLFLAALTLFAMTFVINTLAEVVRLRFRKRAMEL